MEYRELTPEQRAELDACKTPDEIIAFAKAYPFELSEEELKSIAGGGFWTGDDACPNCGSKAIEKDPGGIHCMDCGYTWH